MKRMNDMLIEGAMLAIGTVIATGVGIAFNAAKEAAEEAIARWQERRDEYEA